MTPGQNDAAMIDLGGRPGGLVECGRAGPLNQRSTARGTPVDNGFQFQHGTALAANPFHTQKTTGYGRLRVQHRPYRAFPRARYNSISLRSTGARFVSFTLARLSAETATVPSAMPSRFLRLRCKRAITDGGRFPSHAGVKARAGICAASPRAANCRRSCGR